MMLDPLVLAARHGPWVMIGGLVAGLALPGLAEPMLPLLPWLVGLLLFLAAFRIEPGQALQPTANKEGHRPAAGRRGWLARRILPLLLAVLVLQTAMPLVLLGIGHALGIAGSALMLALLVLASAPSISGNPNIAMMIGQSPAPGLRLLILGTLALPLTMIPVFLLVPGLGGFATVLGAVGKLLAIILTTAGAGLVARRLLLPNPVRRMRERLDGVSALALAVFVVALMPSVSAAFLDTPLLATGWLAAALGANFALQAGTFALLRGHCDRETAVAVALAAGNRNLAVFLVALPLDITAPIVIFIGCYQIPMYLTPLVMRRFYARP